LEVKSLFFLSLLLHPLDNEHLVHVGEEVLSKCIDGTDACQTHGFVVAPGKIGAKDNRQICCCHLVHVAPEDSQLSIFHCPLLEVSYWFSKN